MQRHRLVAVVRTRRPVVCSDGHAVNVGDLFSQNAVNSLLDVVVQPRANPLSHRAGALDVGFRLQVLNEAEK